MSLFVEACVTCFSFTFAPVVTHSGCYSLAMCVCCELCFWQSLKDKPSVLLSYVYVSGRDWARGEGGSGGGMRMLWRFFKKSVGSVASVHRIQFVHSFAGLLSVPLERSSTKWKFPSWNTRGSAGVTVQVSSLMNCVCRQHVTKYLKKS